MLSIEEEAIIVAFRQHTLLPLDDCLYALQATIPHLTRSSLHRCLQRHGISRLPDVDGDKQPRKKFKPYPIGYFHIDIAEVQTAEGKLYLYVAIDRTSKFAFVQLVRKTGRTSASAFLVALIAAVPYRIHTVLTDNGIQFTFPPRYADGPTARYITHMFDMRCRRERHRAPPHQDQAPLDQWPGREDEPHHQGSHRQALPLRQPPAARSHLADFISAYNFGRRLKTLNGLTPYEFIWRATARARMADAGSLIRELHHRVKNTLANVQAMMGATARSSGSRDDFVRDFSARTVSLADAHSMLTDD